jgi:hypothetical protein
MCILLCTAKEKTRFEMDAERQKVENKELLAKMREKVNLHLLYGGLGLVFFPHGDLCQDPKHFSSFSSKLEI